jgi:hypothetical protein
MLRRLLLTLSVLMLALAAVPTLSLAANSSSSTTKANGLLNAAARFDRIAARLTAGADALDARAATLSTEAAASTPADQHKLAQAARLEARADRAD